MTQIRSKIAGIGFYVPKNVVTNDDLTKVMDTSTSAAVGVVNGQQSN